MKIVTLVGKTPERIIRIAGIDTMNTKVYISIRVPRLNMINTHQLHINKVVKAYTHLHKRVHKFQNLILYLLLNRKLAVDGSIMRRDGA